MAADKDVSNGENDEDTQSFLKNNRFNQWRRLVRPRRTGFPDVHTGVTGDRSKAKQSSTPDLSHSTASTATVNSDGAKPWRRGDRRLQRLNTELLEAVEDEDVEEVETLLKAGANPNATYSQSMVSACHIAAITWGDALPLLIKFGAEKHRIDKQGRTPLHLAVYTGYTTQVALLLGIPEDTGNSDATELLHLGDKVKSLNQPCDPHDVNTVLPTSWSDIDSNDLEPKTDMPIIDVGWTPLHVASSFLWWNSTRLLLAAGANPNLCDLEGRTPLDVAGNVFHGTADEGRMIEILQMLIKAGGTFNTMQYNKLDNMDTPLHWAVEVESLEAIELLLDAGATATCLNSAGFTPLHMCVQKQADKSFEILVNYEYKEINGLRPIADAKDKKGQSVLQAAVESAWVPGVCIALAAGADVTSKDNDGGTPIHSAAALGNSNILTEVLNTAALREEIDYQNDEGETALSKAIKHRHLDCVKQILNKGANLNLTLPGNVNVFHIAADYGHSEILRVLLQFDEEVTETLINELTEPDKKGFGPIHFAVSNNDIRSVKLLLTNKADVRLKTTSTPHRSSTPLHLAAIKNHVDITKLILNHDNTSVHDVNDMGWSPLHSASHHGNRDIITLLLHEGADLSAYTDGETKVKRTAIDMIINNLSKPTEFVEDILDSYISSNGKDLQDHDCQVTVNYSILIPYVSEMDQMKVVEALVETGNCYGQTRLLVHPIVESFLCLKWKALLPIFYTIIGLYSAFLFSLTTFIISVFSFRSARDAPAWMNFSVWSYIVYFFIFLIIIQELLFISSKAGRYFFQLETWVKFVSLGLSAVLLGAIRVVNLEYIVWPRHVATVALLLSWLEMMFLLSRIPNWGSYMLMFGKVGSHIVRILLTSMFLLIGFSVSFMIQFRTHSPPDTPLSTYFKTISMVMSDYTTLFDTPDSRELATSLIVVRSIFIIGLVLGAMILINLLVGSAVKDITDLEVQSKIRKLVKQVDFLVSLDTLVFNRVFNAIVPNSLLNSLKVRRNVSSSMTLRPGKPRWRHSRALPSRIREAIFNKAQMQVKETKDEISLQTLKAKLNEIHQVIMGINSGKGDTMKDLRTELLHQKPKYSGVATHLNYLNGAVEDIRNKSEDNKNTVYVEETKSAIDALNGKIDDVSAELKAIKEFFNKLENKFDN